MSDKPKTPGLVIAAAIILILLGTWSLVGGLCTGGGMAFMAMAPEPAGKAQPGDPMAPMRFFVKEVPGYLAIIMTLLVVDMMFGLGQLVSAIGLFKLMPAARIAAIVLTLGKLLLSFAGHVYNAVFVVPAQERFFQLNPPVAAGGPQPPFDIVALTRSLTWVMLAFTIIIQIGITLTIILMLSTKNSKRAFAGQSSEPSDDEKQGKPRSRYEGYDDDDQSPPPKSPGDTGIMDRP